MNTLKIFANVPSFTQVQFIKHISTSNFNYAKDRGKKVFRIYRYLPNTPGKEKPSMQEYVVDLNKTGRMILDILIYIKSNMDSTLAFRRSCREGICGSCGMNIDGVNGLACTTGYSSKSVITIYPLPHMYVVRDLITDFQMFYDNYIKVKPYLIRDKKLEYGGPQLKQSIRDRAKLDMLYECILCGCCTHSCPSYWWNGDRYLGPAALLHAYRWIIDSRDQAQRQRLNALRDSFSIFRCHTILNCMICCPKNLNPAKCIAELRLFLAGSKSKEEPDMKNL